MKAEQLVALLLRMEACFLVLALPAVVMPFAWMSTIHGWVGIGELPHAPIVDYLTRSASLLYASWAPVYFIMAAAVRRYLVLITWTTVFKAAFGLGVLAIDLATGMPWFWTLLEGPMIFLLSVLILVLCRQLQREETSMAGRPPGDSR